MLKRFISMYTTLSQIIFATLLVFLIVNFVPWAGYYFRASIQSMGVETNPFLNRYGSIVSELFPDLSKPEIRQLLRETWTFPLQYDAVAQFRERPRTGKFVNVSKFGFRDNGLLQSWPPNSNSKIVYVFGGSTTFGYGVADNETIPAVLQRQLGSDTSVYNFGRGFFDTNHELLLFVKLLFENYPPNLAIFVDGTNEYRHGGESRLWHTERLRNLDDAIDDTPAIITRLFRKLPIVKFLNWLSVQLFGHASTTELQDLPEHLETAERAFSRYQENMSFIQNISQFAQVDTLFVWQPIPTIDYDTSLIPFRNSNDIKDDTQLAMYSLIRSSIQSGDLMDVVWCASVGQDVESLLYVDSVHYSPEMNRLVAKCIAEHVNS